MGFFISLFQAILSLNYTPYHLLPTQLMPQRTSLFLQILPLVGKIQQLFHQSIQTKTQTQQAKNKTHTDIFDFSFDFFLI
jgi:hypothetical protein